MNPPENCPGQITAPHANHLFRVSGVSVAKIKAAGGMEFVCKAVLEGLPHSQIAAVLNIARSDLSAWLHNENDPRYHRAMSASGEGLLDRAEDELRAAAGKSMADVQIAREVAGLYIRRAGVRNAMFREKLSLATAVMLNAPAVLAAPPQFHITIAPPRELGRVIIEHDPSD